MRVAVIGAGGIGSVFGGLLAAAGHEVWLVHRRREIVEALRTSGLHLETPDGVRQIPIHATTNTREVGTVDLVLILTKATDTRGAAESALPLIKPETVALTLQNGLGNLEIIGEVLGSERVLLGMTYLGAAVSRPGEVRLTAPGATFVGEPGGGLSDRVRCLAWTLSAAGLPTEPTDRLWPMVWGKLVINAALNAICALTGGGGTAVLESPAANHLLGLVAEETAAIATASGVELPYPDAAERVREHCRAVGSAKPSMLQDIERGRPTEIDAINGAIVRIGERLGIPTPLNSALLDLVRAREEIARATLLE